MNSLSYIPQVLLWGAGSQARVVIEMLKENGLGEPRVIFDEGIDKPAFEHPGYFTNDPEALKERLYHASHFVVCIGNEHGYARVMTATRLESLALKPLSIIHDTSFIERSSKLGEGALVMPGAVVHKFSNIGSYVTLNTGSIIEHESIIGDGVHLMPGSVVSGKVRIDDYATIGTNATILPYVHIGEGAYVGAGALVNKDVPPYAVVVGVPAKKLRENKLHFCDQALNYISDL